MFYTHQTGGTDADILADDLYSFEKKAGEYVRTGTGG
jgi:hypothetical protein